MYVAFLRRLDVSKDEEEELESQFLRPRGAKKDGGDVHFKTYAWKRTRGSKREKKKRREKKDMEKVARRGCSPMPRSGRRPCQ